MTFEKAFEAIKKKFADADAKDVRDFALQITLSDEDCGGTFYTAVRGGVLAVEPYDYKENDAVMDISKADFAALVSGRISLDKAVEKGASLKGDASVVDALKATLKKAPKKPAPKKAASPTKMILHHCQTSPGPGLFLKVMIKSGSPIVVISRSGSFFWISAIRSMADMT